MLYDFLCSRSGDRQKPFFFNVVVIIIIIYFVCGLRRSRLFFFFLNGHGLGRRLTVVRPNTLTNFVWSLYPKPAP